MKQFFELFKRKLFKHSVIVHFLYIVSLVGLVFAASAFNFETCGSDDDPTTCTDSKVYVVDAPKSASTGSVTFKIGGQFCDAYNGGTVIFHWQKDGSSEQTDSKAFATGDMTFNINFSTAGLYRVWVTASGTDVGTKSPTYTIEITGVNNWTIVWSHATGYDPGKVTGSIDYNGWMGVFNNQAGYSLDMSYRASIPDPSSISRENTTILINTVNAFVNNFYTLWSMNAADYPSTKYSLLFGLNDILKNPEENFGVTIQKGRITKEVAVSLAMIGKAVTKWPSKAAQYTDHIVLHEVGHSRGLNATYSTVPGDGDWDHRHHVGNASTTCIMLGLHETVPPALPHEFCDFHKKVLKTCLATSIQFDYNPNADCAKDPQ